MRLKQILVPALMMFLFSSPDALAQCRTFVRNGCVPKMTPYVHDGNNQAVIIFEGENADVMKTIFAGQRYRLLICTDDALPDVEFVVSDMQRNILFDNRKSGNVQMWDFISDVSKQIKITIRVPETRRQETPASGCIAVLFGIMRQ